MSENLKITIPKCHSCGAGLNISKNKCDYCSSSFVIEGNKNKNTYYDQFISGYSRFYFSGCKNE